MNKIINYKKGRYMILTKYLRNKSKAFKKALHLTVVGHVKQILCVEFSMHRDIKLCLAFSKT